MSNASEVKEALEKALSGFKESVGAGVDVEVIEMKMPGESERSRMLRTVGKLPPAMRANLIELFFESVILDVSMRNRHLIDLAKRIGLLVTMPTKTIERMLEADSKAWAEVTEAAPGEMDKVDKDTVVNHDRVVRAVRAFLKVKPALEEAMKEEGVSFTIEEILGID